MDAVASTAQNAGLALTWPEFRLRCLDLARKIDFSPFDSIFAVPTSGVCVGGRDRAAPGARSSVSV